MPERTPRPLLFALAVATLLGSAALLALGGERHSDPRVARLPAATAPALQQRVHAGVAGARRPYGPRGEDLRPPARPAPGFLAGSRAVAAAARRFLAVFLRYEVGEIDAVVARALRAAATEEFATALLAAPPHPTAAGTPGRARLVDLQVAPAPGAGPQAVVSGTLRRGADVEGFALLFERRADRWLAAGVAE